MSENIINSETLEAFNIFMNNPNRFKLVYEMIESSMEYHFPIIMGNMMGNNDFLDFKNSVRSATKNQSLGQYLQSLLIEKGFENNDEFYSKSKQSRVYYHKIVSGKIKRPGKDKLIVYALTLKLNNYELDTLLSKAGYSLKDNQRDTAIHWFFNKGIYDDGIIDDYMAELGLPSIFI